LTPDLADLVVEIGETLAGGLLKPA
jgi:hypothetical protein